MDKNRINATINGRTYTLVSEESVEYMNELADAVNAEVKVIKEKNPSLFGERPIVLAALNICDKYIKAENGGKLIIENMQRKYDEIVSENQKLNKIINESDYEIDISSLRSQLENAKKEIEVLKSKLNYRR